VISGRVRNLDPALAATAVVDRALRLAAPNPSARATLGLEGVSEKLHEPLGWFFWLKGAQGPFALEMMRAGEPLGMGVYLIRSFPRPGSPDHECLSIQERNLLASDAFDQTGAPVQAGAHPLAPQIFAVGVMSIIPASGGPEAGLDMELVSRPGWTRSAAWRLFDFLACLLARHYALAARAAECEESEDGESWRLTCAFEDTAAGESPPSSPWFNPAWWRPSGLGISDLNVEYPE
jgi:hypothetical protein